MKTIYTIGQPSEDSSFISFENEAAALNCYDGVFAKLPETDIRRGSVVKKHTFETDAEAETARLDFVFTSEGLEKLMPIIEAYAAGPSQPDWRTRFRELIDVARLAPQPTVVQIWPKPAKEVKAP